MTGANYYVEWLNAIKRILGHDDFREDEEMYNMYLARMTPAQAAKQYEDGYK